VAVWLMDGLAMREPLLLNPRHPGDRNWRVTGVGDFNADAQPDLIYQHINGTLAVWLMQGLSLERAAYLEPLHPGDARWKVRAAADFDGDGRDDLLFQHNDGTLAVWLMAETKLAHATLLNPPHPGTAFWRVAGATDWNLDGKADVLFQNLIDGSLAVWHMDGAELSESRLFSPSSPGGTWKAVAPR
jgi:hypothetical protein